MLAFFAGLIFSSSINLYTVSLLNAISSSRPSIALSSFTSKSFFDSTLSKENFLNIDLHSVLTYNSICLLAKPHQLIDVDSLWVFSHNDIPFHIDHHLNECWLERSHMNHPFEKMWGYEHTLSSLSALMSVFT
jgi:hypothetical protein